MRHREDTAGSFWTLQEFIRMGSNAWYALQKHTESGIERQYTGFKHEMDNLARAMGVTPKSLPPTTEQHFWRTYNFDEQPRMREPHTDSGIYRGLIIAITANSVIQELTAKNFIAHNAQDLDRVPARGQHIRIHYSHGRGTVNDTPLRELAARVRGLGR